MLVYYFRRGKGSKHQPRHKSYCGLDRVTAVDLSAVRNQTSVVWMSHGDNPIRGAPEHLRFATHIEHVVHDSKSGVPPNITQDLRQGKTRMYGDIGHPPTGGERDRT